MSKKNIIRWSFWPILVTLLIVGYIIISKKPGNKHLELIPGNAKAVVIIDSKKILKDYYQLLKYNPKEVDKVLPEDDGDFELPDQLPGISPLEKVSLYVYQDKETRGEQYFKSMLVSVNDQAAFIKTMNGFKETPEKIEHGDVLVLYFKRDNKIVLVNNQVGFVIEPLDPSFEMNIEIGERHYANVFGEDASYLNKTSNSFASVLEKNKQINIWLGSGEGILQGMGGDQLGINRIFNSQSISINLEQNGIETHALLYLNDKNLLAESDNGVAELGEHELLKTSMTVNPVMFDEFFSNLLPESQLNIANSWTGKVCASIVGFRTEPVYQIIKKAIVNEDTFETSFVDDTIELSKNVNLPHFITSAEISEPQQVIDLLNEDSTITKENGFWMIAVPNLLDEYLYIKVSNNNLIISSTPYAFDYEPSYKTFAFSVNIQELLTKYPPKDMLQAIVLPSLNKFEFKSFEMHYDGMNDEYLILHGQLKMGDEKIHTLLQIIPFVYNMIINF